MTSGKARKSLHTRRRHGVRMKGDNLIILSPNCDGVLTEARPDHTVMIEGPCGDGFTVEGNEPTAPPELVGLIALHVDRLRALIDKPVVVCLHWNDGDGEANVVVVPADESLPRKIRAQQWQRLIDRFTLPFPRHGEASP